MECYLDLPLSGEGYQPMMVMIEMSYGGITAGEQLVNPLVFFSVVRGRNFDSS